MDWLRRNWPDLAIGLALVAVIAGIVATLITGGSFFPVTPATTPPSISATVPAADPATTDPVVARDEPASAVAPEPPADVPPPSPGSVSVLTPDGAEVPTPPPTATPTPPAVATPAPATPAPTPAAPAPSAPAPATPAPATPTPVAAAPLPAASGDGLAPYRVSVGAFGNPDNAARQALTFRDAGYPVFTGVQGNLTIVLVGPYDTEAEAQRVADRIAAGGFGIEPVVYRYRPDATTPGASTPGPAAPAPTPAPPAASPAPAAPPAPAAAAAVTGRSLQVGAFANANSAVPLRQRLASLGLVAFEIREDGLTKLLVGPFEEARLAEVRQQLAAQGIESFPR